MKKLIRLLRFAHAVEIGAYHAYEGHWRSLAEIKPLIARKIVWIQSQEQAHKLAVERFLRIVDSKPSKTMDAILWVIGKSISFACYLIGERMAVWGANIMEVMGSGLYYKVASAAVDAGKPELLSELIEMAKTEEEHEVFFKTYLKPSMESALRNRS